MAVAAYAEGKRDEPPPVLEYALNCALFGGAMMPENGGQRDQPAGMLRQMRMAMNYYNAWRDYLKNGKKAGAAGKWRAANPELAKLSDYIKQLRNSRGK
jgi:hypothetical protein